MSDLMQKDKFRNFLIILSLFIGLLSLGFSISMFRQHIILWSQYSFNQYNNKVKSAGTISADLQIYTMCQNRLQSIPIKSNDYANMKFECIKYSNNLGLDFYNVLINFDLDAATRQKILTIQNRQDQDIIDQQSIALTNQVLEVLNNQLKQEGKKLGFQQ